MARHAEHPGSRSFLKATSREGFGDNLFRDWRYNADGTLNTDFALNDPRYKGCILVAGKNFGSLLSMMRELDFSWIGYYSGYCRGCCYERSGKYCACSGALVVVSEAFLAEIFACIDSNPSTELKVDLPAQTITNLATGHTEAFEINAYKKHCLINGLDDIEYLLSRKNDIENWENMNKFY